MTKEIWKDIPGYEGHYMVSNYGRVYSIPRIVNHSLKGKKTIPGKMLKLHINNKGRIFTDLCLNGVATRWYVHRLVMLAFVGPCPNGKEVNHIDFDPTNNHLDNLEYLTHVENAAHSAVNFSRGENRPLAKLTGDDVLEIRKLHINDGYSQRELADMYNVSSTTIHKVVNYKSWKHVK